jgi:DNA-binding NtrC family response regulator
MPAQNAETAKRNGGGKAPPSAGSIRLVSIDDDPLITSFVAEVLSEEGLEIRTSNDPVEGLDVVLRWHPQIVLLDLMMPKLDGISVMESILAATPDTEVVLLTGNYTSESAVEAIKKGACDYLEKPIPVEKLRQRIHTLVEQLAQRHHFADLESSLSKTTSFRGIIGRSPAMLDALTTVRRVAPHFRSVLLRGSTGTGKELIARSLHELSPASGGPFAAFNCSAVVETLFESELFGYVKGAFTGATQDKIGLFEYADRGTLLLDEIGDMPLPAQAKLLRVLQNREVQRVGSPVPRKIDVRIVAATHRDLRNMVAENLFREDLLYRLSMIEIELPRLADRKEDLVLLERYFIRKFSKEFRKPISGLTRRAQALLTAYDWPGNVRELENVIGHGCMMAESDLIDIGDLPHREWRPRRALSQDSDEIIPLSEMERRCTRRAVEIMKGNKVKAAAALGISRAKLYALLADDPPPTGP